MRTSGLALLVVLALVGCTQVGPNTIDRDRFDYADAIASSFRTQTLLNLLRLRYAEVPVFLDVTSVINQYALAGELSAGYNWLPGVPTDAANIGGGARWEDRPTITYIPLTGERLTERLMKPVDPAAILVLAQSGWSMEFLLTLAVQAANGLQNTSGIRTFAESGSPKFFRLMEILSDVQRSGDIGLRIEKRKEGETAVLFFTRQGATEPAAKERLRALQEVLGLDPEAKEYRLVYGSIPVDRTEIALLTRSVLAIMVELAAWIDVPEAHVAEHRTNPTQTERQIGEYRTRPLIEIQHGPKAPATAYASAYFRDTWFWIDDRDFASKRTFGFLQFLFSLVETGTKQIAPVVTVGAGG
jgi:hypothetical protein